MYDFICSVTDIICLITLKENTSIVNSVQPKGNKMCFDLTFWLKTFKVFSSDLPKGPFDIYILSDIKWAFQLFFHFAYRKETRREGYGDKFQYS